MLIWHVELKITQSLGLKHAILLDTQKYLILKKSIL